MERAVKGGGKEEGKKARMFTARDELGKTGALFPRIIQIKNTSYSLWYFLIAFPLEANDRQQ